jgi:hypothetical protein
MSKQSRRVEMSNKKTVQTKEIITDLRDLLPHDEGLSHIRKRPLPAPHDARQHSLHDAQLARLGVEVQAQVGRRAARVLSLFVTR